MTSLLPSKQQWQQCVKPPSSGGQCRPYTAAGMWHMPANPAQKQERTGACTIECMQRGTHHTPIPSSCMAGVPPQPLMEQFNLGVYTPQTTSLASLKPMRSLHCQAVLACSPLPPSPLQERHAWMWQLHHFCAVQHLPCMDLPANRHCFQTAARGGACLLLTTIARCKEWPGCVACC